MHTSSIPHTPQTDPRNFPQWDKNAGPTRSGHPYPKMLTRPFTKEDRDKWLIANRRIDRNTREEYYDERVPKLGDLVPVVATQEVVDASFAERVGEPVICKDAEDEKAVKRIMGFDDAPPVQKPATLSVAELAGSDDGPDLAEAKLIAENDRLRALLAEREELQRKLAATDTPAEPATASRKGPKAKGWPKGKPRGKRIQAPPTGGPVARAKANAARAMSAAQLAADEG